MISAIDYDFSDWLHPVPGGSEEEAGRWAGLSQEGGDGPQDHEGVSPPSYHM